MWRGCFRSVVQCEDVDTGHIEGCCGGLGCGSVSNMGSSGGIGGGSIEDDAVEGVTGPLAAAAADLVDVSLTPLGDDEVVEVMREVERAMRRLTAVQHRVLVAATDRSLPARSGAKSPKKFLMQTLRLSSAEAGARVRQAAWVGRFHDMAGQPVDPVLPHTAHALEDGEISGEHVRGVMTVMDRIPHGVAAAEREAAEQILAEFARTGSPDDLGKIGDRILAHVDPDGSVTSDRDRARRRGLTVGRQRADGMSPIRGEITPGLRALLDPLLAKYARPGVCNADDPDSPAVAVDGVDAAVRDQAARRDHRSAAQRNHDALEALLSSGVIGEELGAHRGLPVTTVLTMSVDEVEHAAGVATTATGGTVPMSEALELAQNSQPFLAVFDHAGLPLHLGRTKRLASPNQRLALIAALSGCSRPGCDAPASLCAVHHVTDHHKGGATDIENLTLACDACHALIHDRPGGWKTVTQGPHSKYPGRTAWIAPPHIDPEQLPRINHRHHASELLAEVLARIHRRNEVA